jgi:hypothetical protein
MLLNPLGLNSGIWTGNYSQPNSAAPAPNPAVTIQPHPLGAASGHPLGLSSAPIPAYIQPNLSPKDDPQGTIRAGKSGKGSAG